MQLELEKEATRARARAVLFGDSPATRVGRYVVLSRLGQGGMGVVWSAFDERLDRKVALKLVHPDATQGEAARAQLLREARALAQLQHQNVVAVYDVGEHDTDVFVAMELVAGHNLRDWARGSAGQRPSSTAVEDAIVQAGRGVAAAHARGIVHRDVKPHNILVGDDGRVKVADFGLARAFAASTTAAPPLTSSSSSSSPSSAAPTPTPATPAAGPTLTATEHRTIGGTPAYMAPEVLLGQRPADALSDQWSLAATAVEALTGERPYRQDNVDELVAAHQRRDPPQGVPSTPFGAVLARALSPDPQARFPTMDGFVEALAATRGSRSRGRLVALGALALVAVVIGVAVAGSGARGEDCAQSSDLLAAAWDDAARDKISHALAEQHQSPQMVGVVTAGFDSYRGRLRDSAATSCEAHRRRAIDAAERERRQLCLERARIAAASLIAKVEHVEGPAAGQAAKAQIGLPDPAACNDPLMLAQLVPLDPTARAAVNDVLTLTQDAEQQRILGKPKEAMQLAEQAEHRAEAAKNDYALATAVHMVGQVHFQLGDADATADYLRAMELGLASGNDDIAVVGLQSTAFHAADRAHAFDEAAALSRVGKALALRLPPTIRQRRLDDLQNVDCVVAMRQSRFDEAKRVCGELLQRREAMFGKDHPATASVALNLGSVLSLADEPERAVAAYADAEQRLRNSFGPQHPLALRARVSRGDELIYLNRLTEARQVLDAVVPEIQSILGEQSTDMVTALAAQTELALAEGKPQLALEAAKHGLEVREALEGAESDFAVEGYSGVALAYRRLGDTANERAAYQRAAEIAIKLHGPDDERAFDAQVNWADWLLRAHRTEDARPVLVRLLALLDAGKDFEKSFVHTVRVDVVLLALADGLDHQRGPKHDVAELKRWAADALAYAAPRGPLFAELAADAKTAVDRLAD